MKAIQCVLAVLFLMLSAAAVAKGPMKDQLVVTPPFSSARYYQVTYLNNSDHQVELEIEIFDQQGNSLGGIGAVQFSPNPGEAGWLAQDLISTGKIGYAHVTWYGNADDLMLMACSSDALTTAMYRSCVRAN